MTNESPKPEIVYQQVEPVLTLPIEGVYDYLFEKVQQGKNLAK